MSALSDAPAGAPSSGSSNKFDEQIDAWWEPLRANPTADRIFYAASNAGEFSLLWHALGGLRALGPRRSVGDAALFSAVMGLESLLVNRVIKGYFERQRPSEAADNPTQHQLRQPITSSFPSGHASAAFCASAMLARGSKLAPLYRLTACAVALSRIHVRLHHASDVIVGAAVGEVLGRLARLVVR